MTMVALFATGDAHWPQAFGGTPSSTDALVRRLRERGHDVAVFCSLHNGGLLEWRARLQMKLRRRSIAIDRQLGYPVLRAWNPVSQVQRAVELVRPDVAIIQNWNATILAREFQRLGLPCVIYLRSMDYDALGGDPSTLEGVRFIANSNFTADQYRRRFGLSCNVIRPTIDTAPADGTPGDKVLFINPVEEKGVDLAIAIAAACPDIPFLFLESWSLDSAPFRDLQGRLASLPNVELRRKTADMGSIYGMARILLAPSQWQEAWGRVASEAHVSGIPVIGSNRGGLPEAIGPGGLVVDYDAPVAAWVAALRSVWDSSEVWQSLSDAALHYAKRPELDADRQLDEFLLILQAAIEPGDSKRQDTALCSA